MSGELNKIALNFVETVTSINFLVHKWLRGHWQIAIKIQDLNDNHSDFDAVAQCIDNK